MYRVSGGFVAAGLLCGLLAGKGAARAQDAAAIPPITVQVDASETARRILHTHLTMPVQPGALTLYFPKWIPGEHAPTGPINSLVDLHLSAGAKPSSGSATRWSCIPSTARCRRARRAWTWRSTT